MLLSRDNAVFIPYPSHAGFYFIFYRQHIQITRRNNIPRRRPTAHSQLWALPSAGCHMRVCKFHTAFNGQLQQAVLSELNRHDTQIKHASVVWGLQWVHTCTSYCPPPRQLLRPCAHRALPLLPPPHFLFLPASAGHVHIACYSATFSPVNNSPRLVPVLEWIALAAIHFLFFSWCGVASADSYTLQTIRPDRCLIQQVTWCFTPSQPLRLNIKSGRYTFSYYTINIMCWSFKSCQKYWPSFRMLKILSNDTSGNTEYTSWLSCN